MPNDVRVVNPRRERSSHDELSVLVNIVSSCKWKLLVKTPKASPMGGLKQRKRPRLNAAFRELSDTCGVGELYLGGVDAGAAGFGAAPAGFFAAGVLVGAGAGTPEDTL